MKRKIFLLAITLVMIMTAGCGPQKNEIIEPVTIDSSNVDEYLLNLPEYDKITVSIDKSQFTEELVDDYIQKYYERLADGLEGLTDEDGNLFPLSEESVKLLNIPAFSSLNEFKVFVRGVVQDFVDKENEEKELAAALEIIRNESTFAEIPEGYLITFRDRIESEYTEIAASYEISANDYIKLAELPMEEKVLTAAKNELIFIKLAERTGLEYQNRDEMVKGVTDYLLGITKVSTKKK